MHRTGLTTVFPIKYNSDMIILWLGNTNKAEDRFPAIHWYPVLIKEYIYNTSWTPDREDSGQRRGILRSLGKRLCRPHWIHWGYPWLSRMCLSANN
jgi:hypothetical protein